MVIETPREPHTHLVRRFAEGSLEPAAEVPRRHVSSASQRLDIQRLGVIAVDPIPSTAEPRQIAQMLGSGRIGLHNADRAKPPQASRRAPMTIGPDEPRVGATVIDALTGPLRRPR